MSSQQHVHSVTKTLNVEYMGFGALKQHAEKQKHKGFASYLSKVEEEMDTHVKETEQKQQKSKQKVMHEFFMKKSDKPKDETEKLQDEGNKTDKQEILKRKCGLLNRWQFELRLLSHCIFQHKICPSVLHRAYQHAINSNFLIH